MTPHLLARPADLLLEASIVGSYTSVGFDVRRRLERWPAVVERDLTGRTYLVTGATRGIGMATAAALVAAGAAVRSLSHDAGHADRAVARLRAGCPDADVEITVADLTRPDDIDRFTARLGRDLSRLDGIAHCAGAFFERLTRTPEGVEANAAIFLLGPHRLNRSLADLLAAAPQPRVVTVSSSGAYLRRLDLDALDPDPDHYRPLAAYALAKRAQIELTHAWAARQPTIAFDAMTPGWCDTDLVRHGLPRFRRVLGPVLRTAEQGADTLAWLLARPSPLTGTTNRLWHDRRPRFEHRAPWTLGGPGADALWDWCERQPAIVPSGAEGRP